MLGEYLSDPLPNPVLRIKASHLRPFVPRLFPPEKPLGDAVSFCVDAHALPHVGRYSLPTSIFGQQDGMLIIGRRAGSADHVCSEAPRERKHLGGVAVVDL